MQSWQLGSVAAGGARNLWSEQPLAPPVEDVITGLEIPVDLPMWSLVGQQDWKKLTFEWCEKSLKQCLFSNNLNPR